MTKNKKFGTSKESTDKREYYYKTEEDIRVAAKAKTKEVSMEEALWKSADKLRGLVEPSEYKHVVLSLFFLKFASDKFDAQREKIKADGLIL